MKEVNKYFPEISELQKDQFRQLYDLYFQMNQEVNVISRKDIHKLYLHHVLHSLSIARKFKFSSEQKILDLGTGGGFPGIPLAIFFPTTKFCLIDGTKKKIRVVNEIIKSLDLKNVTAVADRAESHSGKYHFVVTRAVAKLPVLWNWVKPLLFKDPGSGLIALKGGDIIQELKELPKYLERDITFINSIFSEEYFEEKFIVYIHS